MIVDDVEQTDAAAAGELVVHEVHRQTWLIAFGTAKGSGFSCNRRLRGLIRKFNSSLRHILLMR
jgi:hypothetical protein